MVAGDELVAVAAVAPCPHMVVVQTAMIDLWERWERWGTDNPISAFGIAAAVITAVGFSLAGLASLIVQAIW